MAHPRFLLRLLRSKPCEPVKVAARALTISGLIQICPLKKRLRHFFAEKPLKAH
jgi:hypothetical protein